MPLNTSFPSAHCSFHESTGCPGSAKHPNGTPESTTAPLKMSGYAPARTAVIIAPEDVPTAKTRAGSTPQDWMAKRAALAMESESEPPLWTRVLSEETSQQVPWCGCIGRGGEMRSVNLGRVLGSWTHGGGEDDDISMCLRELRELRALEVYLRRPRADCSCPPLASRARSSHKWFKDSQCDATSSAGFAATFFGLYTNMPTPFSFVPKPENCVSIDAGTAARLANVCAVPPLAAAAVFVFAFALVLAAPPAEAPFAGVAAATAAVR